MGAGLVDEIHDEPAGVADVPHRVLREVRFTIARNGSWNGRVGPEEIKKAEGRGLDAVFFLLRRAPGDRSASDETVGGDDKRGGRARRRDQIPFRGREWRAAP